MLGTKAARPISRYKSIMKVSSERNKKVGSREKTRITSVHVSDQSSERDRVQRTRGRAMTWSELGICGCLLVPWAVCPGIG